MKKWMIWLFLFGVLAAACAPLANETPQATQPAVTQAPEVVVEPTAVPTLEPVEPPALPAQASWIVYTGRDGNLFLLNQEEGVLRQVTQDATGMSSAAGQPVVQYWTASWSSDGQLLAYRRDVGTPVEAGLSFSSELWVYDMAQAASRRLFEDLAVIGMAWKPFTHLLAYGLPLEEGYFTARGQIDNSLAKGIWAVNVDTGETIELVAPQNGYSLRNPRWSRDGRFLYFEETNNYEGSGYFSYFDFELPEYVSWERPLGFVDWSPDSQTLVFDDLTYAASGTERIYLQRRLDGTSEQFSPDYEVGYAFSPRFSPDGEQIAYLAEVGAVDSGQYTLFVQPAAGGEARPLGTFTYGLYLSWLPDASGLLLAAGPFEAREVVLVSVADGSVKSLAPGDAPALPQLAP